MAFCRRHLKTYITEFDRAYGNKQKAIVAQIDDTAKHIVLLMELVVIAKQADLDVLKSRAGDVLRLSQVTVRCLDVNPAFVRPTNNDSYFTLPEFPIGPGPNTDGVCRQHMEANNKLKGLLLDLPKVMRSLINTSSIESFQTQINVFSFESLLVTLDEVSSTLSSCYGEYITLMLDLEEWHRSLSLIKTSRRISKPSVEYAIDVSHSVIYNITYHHSLALLFGLQRNSRHNYMIIAMVHNVIDAVN